MAERQDRSRRNLRVIAFARGAGGRDDVGIGPYGTVCRGGRPCPPSPGNAKPCRAGPVCPAGVRRKEESPSHGFAVPAPFRQGGRGNEGCGLPQPVTSVTGFAMTHCKECGKRDDVGIVPYGTVYREGFFDSLKAPPGRRGFGVSRWRYCVCRRNMLWYPLHSPCPWRRRLLRGSRSGPTPAGGPGCGYTGD